MRQHWNHCCQAFPSCNEQLTCPKCRFTAGTCKVSWMLKTPARLVRVAGWWLAHIWLKLRRSLRDARKKDARRRTQHWTCNVPAIQTYMETTFTSSDLISDVSSLADSDIRDLDFDSVNVEVHSQLEEVSVHQLRPL